MNTQRSAILRLQKRLLDADLLRRTVATFVSLAIACLYVPPPQAAFALVACLTGDLVLMTSFKRLIAEPKSNFWFVAVLIGAFSTMSAFLYTAGYMWLVPGLTPKIGAFMMIFGGMLSVLLVRTIYTPLTIANSLPLLLFCLFMALAPPEGAQTADRLFLAFALVILIGYFVLTLINFLGTQRELALARDTALGRVETQRRFLATMSHELRTPLNGILGMSQAMILKQPGSGAEVIRDSARDMASMVADLLDNAAIEAGALRINLRPCDPSQELRRVVRLWRPQFDAQRLSLELDLAIDLPKRILADPQRLAQCLSNLLSNALRMTQEGGVKLSVTATEPGLVMRVTDTGPGLHPDEEVTLFQPFGHVGLNTGSMRKGVGLGLSISRGLARAMGGDLVFERPADGGATFRLSIAAPLAPATELSLPSNSTLMPATDAQALQGRVILLVDDIATNRLILRLLLSHHGAVVFEASSGAEAMIRVAEIAKPGPDAILMDIRMPGMSGAETLQCLHAAGYHCPIIAISADADPANQTDTMALGFDGYIVKPIEDHALYAMLARVLASPTDL